MKSGRSRIVAAILLACAAAGAYQAFQYYRSNQLETLKENAAAAFASRDWEAAVRATQAWTQAEPDSGEAWIRYANALAMTGNSESALDALNQVPQDYERVIDAREARVNLLLRELRRPEETQKACRELIAEAPENPTAHRLLIYTSAMMLDLKQLNESLRDAMNAGADAPDTYVYLMMLDDLVLMNGAEVTADWLSVDPDNGDLISANLIHRLEAARLIFRKDASADARQTVASCEEERTALLQSLDDHPTLIRSLLRDGLSEGDLAGIRSVLPRVPDSLRNEPIFLQATAFVNLQEGRLPEAHEAIRAALKLNPLSFLSRSRLSEILRAQGELKAAAAVQETAATGASIRQKVAALESMSDADVQLLRLISDYAVRCEDWETVNALARRLPTP